MTDTQYGFQWGQVFVERNISHKGYRHLSIRTKRQHVDIAVTPTGLIRIGRIRKASMKAVPFEELG